jgi:hypothetical protein
MAAITLEKFLNQKKNELMSLAALTLTFVPQSVLLRLSRAESRHSLLNCRQTFVNIVRGDAWLNNIGPVVINLYVFLYVASALVALIRVFEGMGSRSVEHFVRAE